MFKGIYKDLKILLRITKQRKRMNSCINAYMF